MSDMDEDEVLTDAEEEVETQAKEVGGDEKVQVSHLTQETISEGLSLLSKTGHGLEHAYIKLVLKDKGLNDTNIAAISSYIHIRLLDVSNNHLTDLSPLASLIHLLWLKVDNNAVASFKGQPFAQLPFLQLLSMAGNRLTDIDGLAAPSLERLNLTELRGNQLDTTDGINLPNLKELYLAQNVIKRLEGLEKLERLRLLHLRENQLDSLKGLSAGMKCLQYLNVRGNAIADENALQSLSLVSTTLQVLVLSENPLVESSDYRVSVLTFLPELEQLDKDPVTPEERAQALERIKELKEEEIPEP
ncbi:leucine-rich repeat-containing protein 23 isoform X2 [Acanthochromis polyacanthus]|uniref:leucine-rich repeat-containing protein 23 isoform X2 n=1 Tax=Acanthochromis polyacanthus TaxID=80966 RepID=UPI0022346242|nr:leucine-rich repeat-containing protein 23 isoform X2 [Acanthochromis polyacanthus]